MKKILIISLMVLAACGRGRMPQRKCDDVTQINWANKAETICVLRRAADGDARVDIAPVDAKLYLSYIYLSDGDYRDVNRANALLRDAIAEMRATCDGAHGEHDNFCYLDYFKDTEPIPARFERLGDAMTLYHLALPCVYADMILENPDALDLTEAYFGSSRDISIPGTCAPFDPHAIIDVVGFETIPDYARIDALNPEPGCDGTMRFGIQRSNYHDLVEMLLMPKGVLGDMTPDTLSVKIYPLGEADDPITVTPDEIMAVIATSDALGAKYADMVQSATAHYQDMLGLDAGTAVRYARVAVQRAILFNLYYR